jgi:hypothetical protein
MNGRDSPTKKIIEVENGSLHSSIEELEMMDTPTIQ